jgi:hypothetical protein
VEPEGRWRFLVVDWLWVFFVVVVVVYNKRLE